MAKKSSEPKIESYSAVIILDEDEIAECVSRVLAERGYIVTSVDLITDNDGDLQANCFAALPRNLVKLPETQVQD